MAQKLPKRLLEPKDLRNTEKVLDVINPISESLSNALDLGLTLGNIRHALVTAEVTPPDEWFPLQLLNGATPYASGYGYPSVRWTSSGAEYRGLINQGGPDLTDPYVRIPDIAARLRPTETVILPAVSDEYAPAAIEARPDGGIYLGAGASGWLSLWGLRHPCSAEPPLWERPVDVTLQPESQQDWGRPSIVVVVGASRDDRVPCLPDALPAWEAPILTEGRSKRRVLRVQRINGLTPGVRHRVRLLALYE